MAPHAVFVAGEVCEDVGVGLISVEMLKHTVFE